MDHHCPWVNNCVGAGNQKFFILFNASIVIGSIFLCGFYILQGIWWISNLTPNKGRIDLDDMPGFNFFLALVACLLATAFSFVTGGIGWDQLQSITENQGIVESLK